MEGERKVLAGCGVLLALPVALALFAFAAWLVLRGLTYAAYFADGFFGG